MASESQQLRQSIISSLFSPNSKGSAGQTGQAYISHCKTWEDVASAPGERKPRYILLALAPSGQVFLHKSKRNTNGSFSIGKTWDIIQLRVLELIDDSAFRLTIGPRSYTWLAENVFERAQFINLLVRSFRQYSNGALPNLIGVPNDDYSTPAYSLPSASAPANPSSSLSHDPRPRPTQPLTPPRPAPQPPSSRHHSPAPLQPVFRSNSPSPASTSRNAPAPPASGPVARPVLPTRTASSDLATPVRRPLNPPPIPHTPDPPGVRPRASADDDSRPVRPVGSPAKPLRPKVSMPGLSAAPRPHLRAPGSASDTSPGARLISSPLRPAPDLPARKQSVGADMPAESTGSTVEDRELPASRQESVSRSARRPSTDEPPTAPVALEGPVVPKEGESNDFVPDVLANVEEMLEGFEWRMISAAEKPSSVEAGANPIEDQLLTELKALELAEIHAIIENDDRVGTIVTYLDESLAELEKMEALLSLYRTQLNIVGDDVTHIEGQNRGFQVQISNQRALLEEIENIMQTIQIPQAALDDLVQEPLDSQKGISNLERASTSLYKAILSVRDLNNIAAVAAASEDSVEQYKRSAQQFCKRVYEFLVVMFKYQSELVLNDKNNHGKNEMKLPSHSTMESYLERYCGLTLFVKEMDGGRYQQLCAAYFATSSELHKQEIENLVGMCKNLIKKPNEEDLEASFATQTVHSPTNAKMTMPRNPLAKFERRDKKDSFSAGEALTGGEALQRFFSHLVPHLLREQAFVGDFLHIHSSSDEAGMVITYADYAGLEGFFCRAAVSEVQKSMANSKVKDILSVMDLIFGFLPGELKEWVESVCARDPMQVVSVLVALDLTLSSEGLAGNEFLRKMIEGQQRRSVAMFEQQSKEQLKAIERTRLTVKKRKGVVSFVSTFPEFVLRLERQLGFGGQAGAGSGTRKLVDKFYGQIVEAMFESLQTMAREEDGSGAVAVALGVGGQSQEDRDKDRLNYHTMIIENMHHFVTTVSKLNVPALKGWVDQAKEQYDENLTLYIRLVLRRPLGRLIDYFQGMQELLRTSSAAQVSQHTQYAKPALKRVLSSIDKKDLKRLIEALGKRVEKHFRELAVPSAENSVVVQTVWKACQEEVERLVGEWEGTVDRCYGGEAGGGGVGLEFGKEDVVSGFQKYKPGN